MTALRELAERWKAFGEDQTLYIMGMRAALHKCATELLSILDAEGDGGVVVIGYTRVDCIETLKEQDFAPMIRRHQRGDYTVPIYTHPQPVRSGVVSDAFRAGFIEACKWPEPVTQDVDSPAFASALEHFAKSQGVVSDDA